MKMTKGCIETAKLTFTNKTIPFLDETCEETQLSAVGAPQLWLQDTELLPSSEFTALTVCWLLKLSHSSL